MFTLRKYRPADFPRLLEIDHACFVAGIAYSEDELSYFLSMPSAIALVGVDAGARATVIEGFIVADCFRQPRTSRPMGRIITIDVAPQAQHSGLGTLLLKKAETSLSEAGSDSVLLEVAVDNDPALRFYKKHGYSVLKTLPRYYLDSIDGLLMGKKL